jgi:hypothetical protein
METDFVQHATAKRIATGIMPEARRQRQMMPTFPKIAQDGKRSASAPT